MSRWIVDLMVRALQRLIASRMTIHAARMREDLSEFGKNCARALRTIADYSPPSLAGPLMAHLISKEKVPDEVRAAWLKVGSATIENGALKLSGS